jgi:hypothetical protein
MVLAAIFALSAAAATTGCEAEKAGEVSRISPQQREQRAELLRRRAVGLGERYAERVVFYSQELTQLDPRSDRAKASRRARRIVEKFVLEPEQSESTADAQADAANPKTQPGQNP